MKKLFTGFKNHSSKNENSCRASSAVRPGNNAPSSSSYCDEIMIASNIDDLMDDFDLPPIDSGHSNSMNIVSLGKTGTELPEKLDIAQLQVLNTVTPNNPLDSEEKSLDLAQTSSSVATSEEKTERVSLRSVLSQNFNMDKKDFKELVRKNMNGEVLTDHELEILFRVRERVGRKTFRSIEKSLRREVTEKKNERRENDNLLVRIETVDSNSYTYGKDSLELVSEVVSSEISQLTEEQQPDTRDLVKVIRGKSPNSNNGIVAPLSEDEVDALVIEKVQSMRNKAEDDRMEKVWLRETLQGLTTRIQSLESKQNQNSQSEPMEHVRPDLLASKIHIVRKEQETIKKMYLRVRDDICKFTKDFQDMIDFYSQEFHNVVARINSTDKSSDNVYGFSSFEQDVSIQEQQSDILFPEQTEHPMILDKRVFVYVRMKVPRKVHENCLRLLDYNTIQASRYAEYSTFSFDRVYGPSNNQDDLWEDARDIVERLVHGDVNNLCFFAYGQKASGKTYTLLNEAEDAERGILPKVLELLFNRRETETIQYHFSIQCAELKGEVLRDIITPQNRMFQNTLLKQHLSSKTFSTLDEFWKIMKSIHRNRNPFKDSQNNDTYDALFGSKIDVKRTLVITIHLNISNTVTLLTTQRSVSFIDLASSEMQINVKGREARREFTTAQKNFDSLNLVISALHKKLNHSLRTNSFSDTKKSLNQPMVPYRTSKFTNFLSDILLPETYILFYFCVLSDAEHFSESVRTLRYASRLDT